MSNHKLVSVIIPVYNVEKYISKCLESIISQSYNNLEIILVNDGSSQNEEDIIREYMDRDERIRYIKKTKNEGLYAARLSGVCSAHGDYIAFVDSDDYINIDFIRLLINKSIEEDADMVFSTTVTCTPRGSETLYASLNSELYRLPLDGESLRRVFFDQYGCAYVWHTIWNKLYTRALWEKALPFLKKLTLHHVMTEDIIFSSILYFFANKASYAKNATYFYCKHSDASTFSTGINIDQYRTQLNEVCVTFNFIRDFYADKEEWMKESVEKYRNYYGRMWQRLADEVSEKDRSKALALCNKLYPVQKLRISALDDNYFCHMEIPYNNEFDEIKKRIIYGAETVVSFDVFDTLLYRPFYKPSDLFRFLDKKYEEYYESMSSFYSIRVHGEEGCRKRLCNVNKEDISLEDIYSYISEQYEIPADICQNIMKYEEELELCFGFARMSGHELYEIALCSGKKIVLTSDMYLSNSIIDAILKKNGYKGYDALFVSSKYGKLKKTGSLYSVISRELGISTTEILHIGDNYESDVQAANKAGLKSLLLYKATDAFCGKTKRITNNHRISMGNEIVMSYAGKNSFEKNIAYGACISLASNKFFDNPYIGFNDFTDFNVDPYFTGYYVIGMNLIGQIEWLKKTILEKGIKRILFTSRDGKLLMDAFSIYMKNSKETISTDYLYVSRRSMLPCMLKNKEDFLELPIVFQKYSPVLIDELLDFCIKDNDSDWERILQEKKIEKESCFCSIDQYHSYMKLFLIYRFDQSKHKNTKKIIEDYMSNIRDDDGIYDLGYSAAIHRAICLASGKKPVALFMHTDDEKHTVNARRGGFYIESCMNTIPNISGLMREFFFSDTSGSCIGYKRKNGKTIPVLEEVEKHYTDLFPIELMQRGALDMVNDFYKMFGDYLPYMEIRTEEFLMPFESFLVSPSPIDVKMFVSSYFEDKVYGRIEKINVRDFWTQLLLNQKGYRKYDIVSYFDDLLKKNEKKYLAFFGTGKMCEAMFEEYPELPVEVFFDNDSQKTGKTCHGKKIMRPEQYPNLKELYIVVVITFYKEVEEQLRDMGLTKYEDFLNYLELF